MKVRFYQFVIVFRRHSDKPPKTRSIEPFDERRDDWDPLAELLS